MILFERVDILDYETNDYMSYRIIKGKNATKSTSAFLKYKESTDSKTSNSELTIMAYDIKTKKKLSVQFDTNDKVYTHNFKISFLKPLAPNEEFEIIYFIKIPNELQQLSETDEMMSVSLNRYNKRIDKLHFGVCLNFHPISTDKFLRGNNNVSILTDDLHIEEITTNLIESDIISTEAKMFFGEYINDVKILSKLSLNIVKPEKQTYIIYYRK